MAGPARQLVRFPDAVLSPGGRLPRRLELEVVSGAFLQSPELELGSTHGGVKPRWGLITDLGDAAAHHFNDQ